MMQEKLEMRFDWNSVSERDWQEALAQYWIHVRAENKTLEVDMNSLELGTIARFSKEEWFYFLRDKYFRWKYTAHNRYATTTRALEKYILEDKLDELYDIKKRLLAFDIQDIRLGLSIAKEIKGLGIAGASGLLSLMYPASFACVDQFVVNVLRDIPDLAEHSEIYNINKSNIKIREGVLLIHVMQKKAKELNLRFLTNFWTPRKIDMLLWGMRPSIPKSYIGIAGKKKLKCQSSRV